MKYLALTGLLVLSGCSYKVPSHTLRITCVDSTGETTYVRFTDEIHIATYVRFTDEIHIVVDDNTLIAACEIRKVPRR